jgi:hypothetical protein
MQCAVAASHSAMFGARFPARVQPARARTAPRAVSTRAAAWDEEEAAPQRRRGPGFTKEDDPAMTAEKDLFSLARASYGGPRDNQGEADVFSGEHHPPSNDSYKPPLFHPNIYYRAPPFSQFHMDVLSNHRRDVFPSVGIG